MNKTLITLLVSGLLAANAQAAGQDNTWYGGAKLGWSNVYGVDHNQAIKDDYAISEEDKNDVGAGAFLGYQINQNLGVELGYDWLGKYKYTATDKLIPTDISRDEIKAQLAQLTMKIGLPVNESLDLYTRLGAPTPGPTASSWTMTTAPPSSVPWAPNTPSTATGPPVSNTSTPPRSATRHSTRPGPNSTTVCWRSAWSIASVR